MANLVENDGSYVLPSLPPASNLLINCRSEGLTFTPKFLNPVPLLSGIAYGMDFYANEPLPWGGLAGSAISGQVTYTGNGVAGAEVRPQEAGFVTMTDDAGNYQFTNFPGGTYLVVPRKDNCTFFPPNRSVVINSANSNANDFARA